MSGKGPGKGPEKGVTARGEEGSGVICQRVTAAVGSVPAEAGPWRKGRQRTKPVTPEVSAASCKRREAVSPSRAVSPTTAARP